MSSSEFIVKTGMSRAIWNDKYARKKENGEFQTWEERVTEVVDGNFSLDPRGDNCIYRGYLEYTLTLNLAKRGVMPFSGRHLQHGDKDQKNRMGELHTNCSTSMFSFLKFWLLLKGSGVGRCYDNDLCFTNWDYMPNARFVLSTQHPDYDVKLGIESLEEAQHKYDNDSEHVRWFTVEDSGEGWVKVVEILETAAFHKNNKDNLFIFDFSNIRGFGTPIKGQQNRPASGPVPLIQALQQVATVKGAGWKPWRQAMFIDHYLSACVIVGGIRRSSRMATKYWKDKDVFEFIDIKRGGWLYTANNSITVDEEFWIQASCPKPSHGRRVFEYAISASYHDRTGEPGFINIDKLTWNKDGLEGLNKDTYINPKFTSKLKPHRKTLDMVEYMLEKAKSKQYQYVTNPCGEVVLSDWGGYCVIGDICLSNCKSLEDAINAARMMPRFLMRVNLMDFLYDYEVKRTNRIGVSLTGIHEFAYKFFNLTFTGIIDPKKNTKFTEFLDSLREEVETSAIEYAEMIGVNVPHTMCTTKPSGTVSKVMGCTEGAHLPSMGYYMRWVQFPKQNPLNKMEKNPAVYDLMDRGYPMKDISKQYKDHVVVGFPTKLGIADLMGDDLVTAGQAEPWEQYKWLQLLEKHWLGGPGKNNQVSYTLKYNPQRITQQQYSEIILNYQSSIRCCAIMPQEDNSAYIYTPEEEISEFEYDQYMSKIYQKETEAYDETSLECAGGSCPIEGNINQ
jgi:ribonucleoside-triphosphate reductase (formate)